MGAGGGQNRHGPHRVRRPAANGGEKRREGGTRSSPIFRRASFSKRSMTIFGTSSQPLQDRVLAGRCSTDLSPQQIAPELREGMLSQLQQRLDHLRNPQNIQLPDGSLSSEPFTL